MKSFYMVSFEATGNFYFFREKENAFAFVLENYCDDYPDLTNTELGEVNLELADNDYIADYAWIDKVYFEDGN